MSYRCVKKNWIRKYIFMTSSRCIKTSTTFKGSIWNIYTYLKAYKNIMYKKCTGILPFLSETIKKPKSVARQLSKNPIYLETLWFWFGKKGPQDQLSEKSNLSKSGSRGSAHSAIYITAVECKLITGTSF